MRYEMGRAIRVDEITCFPAYGAISFRPKHIVGTISTQNTRRIIMERATLGVL